jgi:predicted HTH transcriptional regulator
MMQHSTTNLFSFIICNATDVRCVKYDMMMMKKTKERLDVEGNLWLLYDTILPFIWKNKRKSNKKKSLLL